jgi:hypothetical protein
MNESQPSLKFAAITVLPVVAAHSCLAPLWLTQTYAHSGGDWLPAVAVLLTALLIPAYLAVLGCRLVLRRIPVAMPLGLGVLLGSLALNVFLDCALWGIGSGMFWTPDEMTLVIIRAAALVGLGILAAPPLVALLIRYAFQSAHTVEG